MGLFDSLKESFSSTWLLLNDTTTALSRAKMFLEYEKDLREWRAELQTYKSDAVRTDQVRDKVRALRKFLREQGLELILGQKDIQAKGWRHDDAFSEGFSRCVLLISDRDIQWAAGEVNHVELKIILGQRLDIDEIDGLPGLHSLWFRWTKDTLEFSGADSEAMEDWDTFCRLVVERKNFLIKRLKNLR